MDEVAEVLKLLVEATQLPFVSTIVGYLVKIYDALKEIKYYKTQCIQLLEESIKMAHVLNDSGVADESVVPHIKEFKDIVLDLERSARVWRNFTKMEWLLKRHTVADCLKNYERRMQGVERRLNVASILSIRKKQSERARQADEKQISELERRVRSDPSRFLISEARSPLAQLPHSSDGLESHILRNPGWKEYGPWPDAVIQGEEIKLLERIGNYAGKFETYRGETRRRPRRFVAVQVVKDLNDVRFQKLNQDVNILTQIKHDNIVTFLGLTPMVTPRNTKILHLLFEWCDNGSVVDYLKDKRDQGEPVNLIRLVKDIACGLHYLHTLTCPISHGDIRPGKILIAGDGSALLSGFSRARIVGENITSGYSGDNSTALRYYAPEIMKAIKDNDSLRVDVYMWAVTSLKILTGKEPFEGITGQISLMNAVTTTCPGEKATYFTSNVRQELLSEGLLEVEIDELWDLLERSWNQEPSLRPKIQEVFGVVRRMCVDGSTVREAM